MTNTNKLLGRMIECGYNRSSFSKAMNFSRPTLNNKLNNHTEFLASEIKKACEVLKIDTKEIPEYFF